MCASRSTADRPSPSRPPRDTDSRARQPASLSLCRLAPRQPPENACTR
jgi:hypothetical protein